MRRANRSSERSHKSPHGTLAYASQGLPYAPRSAGSREPSTQAPRLLEEARSLQVQRDAAAPQPPQIGFTADLAGVRGASAFEDSSLANLIQACALSDSREDQAFFHIQQPANKKSLLKGTRLLGIFPSVIRSAIPFGNLSYQPSRSVAIL